MAFTVLDVLNEKSKAGIEDVPRARFRTKDISIFKMYRNEKNFYSIEAVEELAGEILMYGLKQNLELVYEPCEKGEYRIIAGERRWMALKLLVEKGYKEFEIATCKLSTPQGEAEEQVEIIIANAYRDKSIKDVLEEERRLKAALEKMKVEGKKIKGYDINSGRLRDVIASMLKMSRTKVAQIESINNNLIPEFKEELENERLTFSAAYELSGMKDDEQNTALEKYKESGELTNKEVRTMKEEKEEGEEKTEYQERQQTSCEEYQEPHPEGITSLGYSCKEYAVCDAKMGTCTKCDRYINKAESEKTEEQRYSEEQDRIDRETKRKLREMEDEKKMECLPSENPVQMGDSAKYIRTAEETFKNIMDGKLNYLLLKDDGYKEGLDITLGEFAKGKATGRTLKMTISHMDDEETSSALESGYCVIGIRKGNNISEREQPELPIFKNNEQRKAWIEDVEAWGLWYEDANIQARYYKYDFPDGSRLIAVKYRYTCPPWMLKEECFKENQEADGDYKDTHYHMIYSDEYRKNQHKNPYVPYEQFYTNSTVSVSILVEYLKHLQKKEG